jgi:hypothetical protein
MAWTQTVTTVGLELLADAFGRTLNISRVACASGSVPINELPDQTDLTDYVKDLSILSVSTSENNSIIKARLTNQGITNPTLLSQMGVYAQLDTEPEVLLAIFQNDTPSTIPTPDQQAGYEFEPEFQIVHSNVANVTASIDWGAYATLQNALDMADAEKNRAQTAEQILTAGKEDKVTGKGLSSNDYTTDEKNKLAAIDPGATSVQIVQTTGDSQTSVMSQDAVTRELTSSATGWLKSKNFTISGTDVEMVDYDPNEWNANYVLPYGATLPTPADTSILSLAIQAATDPLSAASDAINAYTWDTTNQAWVLSDTSPIAVGNGFLFYAYPPGGASTEFYWAMSEFNQLDAGAIDPSLFAPSSHVSDSVASATGVHGIRYYNGQLQVWNGDEWDKVQGGSSIGVGN